jgi:hypothetical protein
MRQWQMWRALAAGAIMALPAAAQDVPIVAAPAGGVVEVPSTARAAPCPPEERPGLSGWRRRHAERKRHFQEHFWGVPEEFNEWPLGRAVYDLNRTAVANAADARMIFNHADFVGDTAALNYRGRDKLAAVVARLPASFAPVVIERTPRAPGLDEVRRLAVLGKLAAGPFPVPAERVVVGPAIARGLGPQEGLIVYGNRLGQFAAGGGNVTGAGGPGGALDASGLSSGAPAGGGSGAAAR